ncbi:hypothetical protein A6R68_16802 [Neotoma lepida]|uniref:Metalloprotease TIKI n=1 Tax=Neotoma lepida TaxID=56216 RepID=A0A1A6HGH9_NEOLE|nr:hypothetical protein A6R68_16802 [Neotoma lepida]
MWLRPCCILCSRSLSGEQHCHRRPKTGGAGGGPHTCWASHPQQCYFPFLDDIPSASPPCTLACSHSLPCCSPATGSPAPSPEGTSAASPAPATPAAAVPEATSATPTTHPEEEDPVLSPHLLLPDSLSQLEEFGRQKWRKRLNKQQRPRQFNDLWVRIEDSTTVSPPPLPLQPTPSSGTTKPFVKSSHHLQQQDIAGPTSNSAPTLGFPPAIAATIVVPFLLHTLGPS